MQRFHLALALADLGAMLALANPFEQVAQQQPDSDPAEDGFTRGPGGEIVPNGNPQSPPLEESGWKDTAMVAPNEILRVIDSLQLTSKYKVATPANWKDGQDVIVGSSVSDEEAKKLVPQGWKTVKPYLRVLPQPK